jgi:dienelactone hydrolase
MAKIQHCLIAIMLLAATAAAAAAQQSRPVTIWSQGVRLAGDLWTPPGWTVDVPAPAIVLANGWSGLRSSLNQAHAPIFAEGGFVVLTFDYRGWGDSEARLVLAETLPQPDSDGILTVRAYAERGVIDPQDQIADLLAAVAFVIGEPGVDAARVGVWGTSYGGGHAIEAAARDPRIAAVVAQVGFMGVSRDPKRAVLGLTRATQKARGALVPLPEGTDRRGSIPGTPDLARMAAHRPLDLAGRVRAATLIIDAAEDQYFDPKANGEAVYEVIRANAPALYQLFPGDHYSPYGPYFEEAVLLTVDWFQSHLGGG